MSARTQPKFKELSEPFVMYALSADPGRAAELDSSAWDDDPTQVLHSIPGARVTAAPYIELAMLLEPEPEREPESETGGASRWRYGYWVAALAVLVALRFAVPSLLPRAPATLEGVPVANAQVFVDGEPIGATDGRFVLPVADGEHHVVQVRAEGYEPYSTRVLLTPGTVVDLSGVHLTIDVNEMDEPPTEAVAALLASASEPIAADENAGPRAENMQDVQDPDAELEDESPVAGAFDAGGDASDEDVALGEQDAFDDPLATSADEARASRRSRRRRQRDRRADQNVGATDDAPGAARVLRFTSDPPGAVVTVMTSAGARRIGRTPVSWTVPESTTTVWVSMALNRHRMWERRVQVRPDAGRRVVQATLWPSVTAPSAPGGTGDAAGANGEDDALDDEVPPALAPALAPSDDS